MISPGGLAPPALSHEWSAKLPPLTLSATCQCSQNSLIPPDKPTELAPPTLPASCRCFQNSPIRHDIVARLPPLARPANYRSLPNSPVRRYVFLSCLLRYRRPPLLRIQRLPGFPNDIIFRLTLCDRPRGGRATLPRHSDLT